MIQQLSRATQKLAARGVRDRVTGCLLWTGAANAGGYGIVWLDGKAMLVHRVSYELTHGEVPTNKIVAHRCDNTLCFEPAHLDASSQSKNLQQTVARGRLPTALNSDAVRKIRALEGVESARAVGLRFGVSSRTIYRVWRRQSWTFVDDAPPA